MCKELAFALCGSLKNCSKLVARLEYLFLSIPITHKVTVTEPKATKSFVFWEENAFIACFAIVLTCHALRQQVPAGSVPVLARAK